MVYNTFTDVKMRIKLVTFENGQKSVSILFDASEERILGVYQLYTYIAAQAINFLFTEGKNFAWRDSMFSV